LRNAKGKDSLRFRREVAACDDDFLASLIAEGSLHPIALGGRHDAVNEEWMGWPNKTLRQAASPHVHLGWTWGGSRDPAIAVSA